MKAGEALVIKLFKEANMMKYKGGGGGDVMGWWQKGFQLVMLK